MNLKRLVVASTIAFNTAATVNSVSAQNICDGYSLMQSEGVCPKPAKSFCRKGYRLTISASNGNLSSECVKIEDDYDSEPVKPKHSLDSLKRKISNVKKNLPQRGRKIYWHEMIGAEEKVSKWSKQDVEDLITKLNGNLNDEERKIFRGALRYWLPLKYHADRLGIDPRLVFVVAVTESRMVQEKGHSGEVSIMQIMPKTAKETYLTYGKTDNYLKYLKKTGKDWHTDKDALIVLSLYYLKHCIKVANSENLSFENITPEQLLNVYFHYNKGLSNKMRITWQLNNFSSCTAEYLRLYPLVESFVDNFLDKHGLLHQSIAAKPYPGSVKKEPVAVAHVADAPTLKPVNKPVAIVKNEVKPKHEIKPKQTDATKEKPKSITAKNPIAESHIAKVTVGASEKKEPNPTVVSTAVSNQDKVSSIPSGALDEEVRRVAKEQAEIKSQLNELRALLGRK